MGLILTVRVGLRVEGACRARKIGVHPGETCAEYVGTLAVLLLASIDQDAKQGTAARSWVGNCGCHGLEPGDSTPSWIAARNSWSSSSSSLLLSQK